jgi:hypothetical protein
VPVKLGFEQVLAAAPARPPCRPLNERECQCRAASESTLGNLFASQRQLLAERRGKHLRGDHLRDLQMTILAHSEAEARNQSAGGALELFYRLSEAEARHDIVRESIAAMTGALAKTKDLTCLGILVEVDYEDLLRQRLDLQADAVQLAQGIDKLNGDLKVLLGIADCGAEDWRIRPVLALPETIDAVDPAAALAEGNLHRPALTLVRMLPGALSPDTLPAARMLLVSYNALLGAQSPAKKLRICAVLEMLMQMLGGHAELDRSRHQLQVLAAEREQTICNEIRIAAAAVNRARARVALAREQVRIRKDRLDDLDAKAARGIASFKDTTAARLAWLQSRGQQTTAAADLLVARAKLREAEGALLRECCE